MIATQAIPGNVPFTPAAGGELPVPNFTKQRDPVWIEPDDGLTQAQRWEAALQAVDEIQREDPTLPDRIQALCDWEYLQDGLENR